MGSLQTGLSVSVLYLNALGNISKDTWTSVDTFPFSNHVTFSRVYSTIHLIQFLKYEFYCLTVQDIIFLKFLNKYH